MLGGERTNVALSVIPSAESVKDPVEGMEVSKMTDGPHLIVKGGSGTGAMELARATISSMVLEGFASNSTVLLGPFPVMTTVMIMAACLCPFLLYMLYYYFIYRES